MQPNFVLTAYTHFERSDDTPATAKAEVDLNGRVIGITVTCGSGWIDEGWRVVHTIKQFRLNPAPARSLKLKGKGYRRAPHPPF